MLNGAHAERTDRTVFLVFFLVLLCMISSFLSLKGAGFFVDEIFHSAQVYQFVQGDYSFRPGLTMMPGYHFVAAMLVSVFPYATVSYLRCISLGFAVLSILAYFLLARSICKDAALDKTLQYCLFPILFPFFFLIYTDVFSLLAMWLTFYALFRRNPNYVLAGVLGIVSLLVRQNNIVWLAFACGFIYCEKYFPAHDWATLKKLTRDCWMFVLGFVAFAVFVLLNGGVALGDRAMHPTAFHTGNVFFLLLLFFPLFLPLNIANFPGIVRLVKKHKTVLVLLGAVFFIYLLTFTVDHPYNLKRPDYFLRNRLLAAASAGLLHKALYFIPIAYSILSIAVTRLHKRAFYLLYPITFLYLVPSWLIDPRYYLLPFSLFILFRERRSDRVEYSSIVLYGLSSLALLYGIRQGIWFP